MSRAIKSLRLANGGKASLPPGLLKRMNKGEKPVKRAIKSLRRADGGDVTDEEDDVSQVNDRGRSSNVYTREDDLPITVKNRKTGLVDLVETDRIDDNTTHMNAILRVNNRTPMDDKYAYWPEHKRTYRQTNKIIEAEERKGRKNGGAI